MNLIRLDDPTSSLLAPFVNLKYNKSEDYIVVDGSQTLENLLLKGATPLYIIATPEYFESRSQQPDCPLYVSERAFLKSVVGFSVHQGVLALFAKIPPVALSEMGDRVLCLNGLTSAENVGTIVRSAVAFEVDSILTDFKTISPYSRRAVRVSMGHFFDIKHYESKSLVEDLLLLKSFGHMLIGTRNSQDSIELKNFCFPHKFALIIGSEGKGMDQEIEAIMDVMIKIKIKSGIDSLNAAQACSIVLSRI